ncbi:hypothetical protein [Peristeroidobacter soli]|jgi:hypothetical protein|uniref:hypothetical protein n=1 Tax=Peristeroidobacter soli TaxID=2497877 RepID=UPI00101BAE8A|nr:hypothetical protein [Peristeroidobacter soli]
MRNSIVLLVAATLFAGCAVVKINHDATDSVEHAGGDEKGKELANRACSKARAVRAEVVSTVQKDAGAPNEKTRYITTFRCIY